MIKLQISEETNSTRFELKEMHTVKNLNLPVQSLDFSDLCKQFPYLQGLPIRSYAKAVPTILIGLDNTCVMATRKSEEGAKGNPIAAKTRLGWAVYGTTYNHKLTEELTLLFSLGLIFSHLFQQL